MSYTQPTTPWNGRTWLRVSVHRAAKHCQRKSSLLQPLASFASRGRKVRLVHATRFLTPAGDVSIAPHPTGVGLPYADGVEGTLRRRGLTVLIVAPADDGAVASHPADVDAPGADGVEGTPGRRGFAVFIVAPTDDGAVASHPAVVGYPGADGVEGTTRRRGLILAPAGDGAVTPNPAAVCEPGADGVEGTSRWRRRTRGAIVAPAGDGSVAHHAAGVGMPGADGFEGWGIVIRIALVVHVRIIVAVIDVSFVVVPTGITPRVRFLGPWSDAVRVRAGRVPATGGQRAWPEATLPTAGPNPHRGRAKVRRLPVVWSSRALLDAVRCGHVIGVVSTLLLGIRGICRIRPASNFLS